MYTVAIEPAMKPSDAFACIAHGKTERVEIDRLEGRISTTLLTPYPPGIPLLIPGEKFNRKIVDYLRFTRAFNKAFPGFDTDVHGLMSMVELEGVGVDDGKYFVDCVRTEAAPGADGRARWTGAPARPGGRPRGLDAAPGIAWLKPPST